MTNTHDKTYLDSNLTRRQLLVWAAQEARPDSTAYTLSFRFEILGALEIARFHAAFERLVRESDALRTVFHRPSGVPRRVVLGHVPRKTTFLSLVAQPDPDHAADVHTAGPAGRSFPLDQPLYHSFLFELAPDRFRWSFLVHHLAADGYSGVILFERMATLYSGEGGAGPPMYASYVEQERARKSTPSQVSYWVDQARRTHAQSTYYGVAPRSAKLKTRGHPLILDPESSRRISALAASSKAYGGNVDAATASLFMAVTAALISRIGGSRRFTLAMPFRNRSSAFRRTVGLFTETYPIHFDFSRPQTFAGLVRSVAAQVAAHRENGPWTFFVPERCGVVNYHVRRSGTFARFSARAVPLRQSGKPLPFMINVFSAGDTIEFNFELDEALFGENDARRFITHFRRMLVACIDDAQQRTDLVDLLTPDERSRLMAFNPAPRIYPGPPGIHQFIEMHARGTPGAVALVSDRERVDYAALNARANRLAHYLMEQGLRRGEAVAVYLNRSPETIIVFLALLKAGAVYLPLAPGLPRKRAAFILRDADTRWVVTETGVSDTLPPCEAQIVLLDAHQGGIDLCSPVNPDHGSPPDAPAYIIYTSGSTGGPKGVVISHAGIRNRLLWAIDTFVRPTDRMLFHASIMFDVSIAMMFTTLLRGGATVIAAPDQDRGRALYDLVLRHRVTITHGAVSSFRDLMAAGDLSACKSLRRIHIGAEVVPPGLVRQIFAALGPVELVNAYGPTESSVGVAFGLCRPDAAREKVPIGRPIPNTRIYLLDEHLQLVPEGVAGEICIGGVGVARGYLNRPELTAARFVRDPFSPEAGARLYRSGDLARFLPDGQLEFLGRLDNQVQIQGHRVEPEEIEAVLHRHPSVVRAVVVYDAKAAQLSAHLVLHRDAALALHEVRKFLWNFLPAYMVPACFRLHEEIPLLPSGKVDRRRLLLDDGGTLLEPRHIVPRTTVEHQVANIWGEVLQRERVGRQDDFLGLGGDSLAAIQVVARIERHFDLRLPVSTLLESATLGGFAQELEARLDGR